MNLVKRSLYLCIGVLLALLAVQATQTLVQVSRLSGATEEVVTRKNLAAEARKLLTQFVATEQALSHAIAFVDATRTDALRQAYGEQATVLRAQLDALQGKADGALQADATRVGEAVAGWLALAAPHVGAQAVTALPSYHRLDDARTDVEAAVDAFVASSDDAAVAAVAASHALAQQAMLWTIATLVVAVALGALLGWQALRNLHRQLGADASEVARVANAVADGDLTVAIAADRVPQGSVMAAMARMQSGLRETVSGVVGIAANLADGANEIAAGNGDLSQRTEQQAAALERTASTMAELGATVQQNAQNAVQASRLADEASEVAARGGAVVGQAVETMRGINDSSRRIADIIGVIDGIAFQTNILALNAAVEAARAGEQGRGFAVVAGEVRSLAQRSAAAAKEIKALISDSVGRVESGSALVEQAGQTMQEVVQSIERVTAVMAEIRSASAEQSDGVALVGEAIGEMDRSTQQNAALAEQSAAAAESLKAQGQQLVAAMAFFRVDDGVAAPAAHMTADVAVPHDGGLTSWDGVERRGPHRARNVVRPAFGGQARPAAVPAPQPSGLAAATGTDGWSTH